MFLITKGMVWLFMFHACVNHCSEDSSWWLIVNRVIMKSSLIFLINMGNRHFAVSMGASSFCLCKLFYRRFLLPSLWHMNYSFIFDIWYASEYNTKYLMGTSSHINLEHLFYFLFVELCRISLVSFCFEFSPTLGVIRECHL